MLLVEFFAQPLVFRFEPGVFQRVAHDQNGLFQRQRLFHEIKSAQLGRPHCRLDISMPGNHHHHRRVVLRPNPFERFQSVQLLEPNIEQNQIELALFQNFQAGFARIHGGNLVALVAQQRAQRFPDSHFVVDN